MKVVIAGGGIAGLACAVALGCDGVRVDVCERAERFTEIGAGIQLAANSFRALDTLGVASEIIQKSVPVRHLTVRDGLTGELLVSMNTGDDYTKSFGYPYMVVHRRDIHGVLLQVAQQTPGVRLHARTAITGFVDIGGRVTAMTTGSSQPSLVADVLIGADGIRSAVRAQLLADGPPTTCGHTIYRSVIDMDGAPAEIRSDYVDLHISGIPVTLWAGTDWHMIAYPISGGRQLNLAITQADGSSLFEAGAPAESSHVVSIPEAAHRAVRALLRAGRDWKRWTLVDRAPTSVWSVGRVVLVGDAAHPMLQYAAQGAGMAIEDAVLIAQSLRESGPISDRLLRFAASRAPRAAAVQNLAVELGRQVYHAAARPRSERNRWLTSHNDMKLREMVRWLHGSTTFIDTPAAGFVA